jgi:hypothetical protein
MPSVKLLFILLFAQITAVVYGQRLPFRQWENVALPSQECYNILRDHKGYIWFSTEQGFCHYDGKNITVYDRRNGLPEAAVYSVVEDRKGRLWLLTSKRRILILENGKLREAPFSKQYQSSTEPSDIAFSFKLIDNEMLYINSQLDSYRANIDTNKLERISGGKKNTDHLTIRKFDDALVPINDLQYHSGLVFQPRLKLNIYDRYGLKQMSIQNDNKIFSFRFFLTEKIKDGFLCCIKNKIIRIYKNGGYSHYEFPQRILSMYGDQDGGIWLGFLNAGLYYYPNGNLDEKPLKGLKSYSVSGILSDQEKNIWCTTLEKGLFFCRNPNVVSYSNLKGMDKPVEMLQGIGETVYASGGANVITSINGSSITQQALHSPSNEPVFNIAAHQGKFYISGSGILMETDKNFKKAKNFLNEYGKYTGGRNIRFIHDSLFVTQLFAIGAVSSAGYRDLIRLPARSRFSEYLSDGKWLAGSDGLYLVDIKKQKVARIPGISDPVTKILKTRDAIWITTKGGGLYQYQSGKAISRNRDLKIKTGVLFDIIEDSNKNLWLASNQGVIRLQKQRHSFKASSYTTANGLPSNIIYKLAIANKMLFLSTTEGICSLPLSANLSNRHSPLIYFDSVFINDKAENPDVLQNKLPYDKNALRFTFDVLAFKGNTPQLYYILAGKDTETRTVNDNEILLDHLAPDNYRLSVFAVNSDGIKSKIPVILNFEIAKPFWLTWWFLLICLTTIIIVVYFINRRLIAGIKRKEAEKTHINKLIADSRLSALQAQMNPHFIFNAINSIQNYILKSKEEEAYDYLTKFSKLIRLVLQNSRQKLLSLHEELETIRLYIELEQLRFQDFEFELTIGDSVEEYEVMIPAMLIQPYLENAIWHGLMPLKKNKKGKIKLDIAIKNKLLRIIVEDNGVGREWSRQHAAKNPHQPIAMKLAEERLSIVNALHSKDIVEVRIIDLFGDLTAAGTRIEIYLPLDYDG